MESKPYICPKFNHLILFQMSNTSTTTTTVANFTNKALTAQGLDVSGISKAVATFNKGRAKDFDASLALGAKVTEALTWYTDVVKGGEANSRKPLPEFKGDERLQTVSAFLQSFFGLGKAWLYRVAEANTLAQDADKLATYFGHAEGEGLSIKAWIDFAKNGVVPGAEDEGEGKDDKPAMVWQFTLAKQGDDKGCNVKMDSEGGFDATDLRFALAAMQKAVAELAHRVEVMDEPTDNELDAITADVDALLA